METFCQIIRGISGKLRRIKRGKISVFSFPSNDLPAGNKSRRRIASGWSITRINLPAEAYVSTKTNTNTPPTLAEITRKFPRYPSSIPFLPPPPPPTIDSSIFLRKTPIKRPLSHHRFNRSGKTLFTSQIRFEDSILANAPPLISSPSNWNYFKESHVSFVSHSRGKENKFGIVLVLARKMERNENYAYICPDLVTITKYQSSRNKLCKCVQWMLAILYYTKVFPSAEFTLHLVLR